MSLSKTDGTTAREQLHQIAEQRKTELENTLLKEALAQSSERCEESLKTCATLLQRAEQNWQQNLQQNYVLQEKHLGELDSSVSETMLMFDEKLRQIKDANAELATTISDQISKLVDSVREATVAEVQSALTADKQELAEATAEYHSALQGTKQNMMSTVTEINNRLKSSLNELEERQRKFFSMHGFKHFVFWLLPFLQLAEMILLIVLLSSGE